MNGIPLNCIRQIERGEVTYDSSIHGKDELHFYAASATWRAKILLESQTDPQLLGGSFVIFST